MCCLFGCQCCGYGLCCVSVVDCVMVLSCDVLCGCGVCVYMCVSLGMFLFGLIVLWVYVIFDHCGVWVCLLLVVCVC